jgi:PAS domain S-box-containing protein
MSLNSAGLSSELLASAVDPSSKGLDQYSDPEYHRAQTALKESESRFRDLFETVHLIAIILDEEGDISFCNEFLLRFTGWRKEEIIGRNWCELFVPAEQYPRHLFKSQLADGLIPAHHDNEILTKNGDRRLISWHNTVLFDSTGKPVGTASLGQDITVPRQVEEALQKQWRIKRLWNLCVKSNPACQT